MKVELRTKPEHIQDMIENAVRGAQTSHGNKGNETDVQEFLLRLISWGHESVLEHIFLTFEITGITRACLQELARHRLASMTVESTRYTLKEILYECEIEDIVDSLESLYSEMNVLACFEFRDTMKQSLGIMINLLAKYPEMPNDVLKYFLPEFWPTNLTLSVNIRELRHIIDLRTSSRALKEFQVLAHELFNAVPDEFKYLLEDCVHKEVQS